MADYKQPKVVPNVVVGEADNKKYLKDLNVSVANVRSNDYKLVRYDSNADTLTGKANQPVTAAKLYNLRSDPSESQDLAAAMPEKVTELQMKWDRWNADNAAPLWGAGSGDSDGAEPRSKGKKKKSQAAE